MGDVERRSHQDQLWYWGERSQDFVVRRLSGARDGSFLVFKPEHGSDDILTLAVREGEETKLVPIHTSDGLYGFTEILSFMSLEEMLDAYNQSWNCENTLRYAADPTITYTDGMDATTLLIMLRKAGKQMKKKNEEFEEKELTFKRLQETFDEQMIKANAYQKTLELLDGYMKKHRVRKPSVSEASPDKPPSLSARTPSTESLTRKAPPLEMTSRSRSVDIPAENSIEATNQQNIVSQRTTILKAKEVLEQEMKGIQDEKKEAEIQYYSCRAEAEKLKNELNDIKSPLLRRNQDLASFVDSLLQDCEQPLQVHVVDMDIKSAEKRLKGTEDGTFVVRRNKQKLFLSLSCLGDVKHYVIIERNGLFGLDNVTCIFDSLDDLMQSFTNISFGVYEEELDDVTLKQELTLSTR